MLYDRYLQADVGRKTHKWRTTNVVVEIKHRNQEVFPTENDAYSES